MTPSMFRGACILLGLLLAGCVETRFESPPGDNIETCDARWKGLWIGADAGRKGELDLDDVAAFHVGANCEFTVLDQAEPGGPLKHVRVPLNFVHAHGRDYIVVADSALAGVVTLDPPHGIDPVPKKSYFIARYRVRGDRIEVYTVDSRRAASLVVEGSLDGTVDKTRTNLRVYIEGDRARTLEILRKHAIFEAKPTLELVRSRIDLEAFERSLRQPRPQRPREGQR
ncbi:MAG: hypothetical protein EOP90_02495 [Lysobacteraceae bacterium]|nr:MAG: hypothetical protein EOP90_02495 [Xanthomonadaceae bacterium]